MKVYCEECKFFVMVKKSGRCFHVEYTVDKEDEEKGPERVKKSPKEKNQNHDCKWYAFEVKD